MRRREPTVSIPVEVTLSDYLTVATLAEQRGHETIAEWIEDIIRTCGEAGRIAADPVAPLVLAGLSDAAIAGKLDLLLHTVASRRRRAGLSPNRRYSRKATR